MKVVKIMKTLYLLSYTQRKRKESDTLRIMRDIIILIIPAIIEYSFQALVNYADFIMVGKLGMKASATIGITNEVTFLVKASVNALSVGVVAYFAKEIGAGRRDKLQNPTLQAYLLAFIIGIFTTIIPLSISPVLPKLLGASKELRSTASIYFAVSSSAGLFFSFNVIAGSIRKATKDMKTPLIINGLVNILNIIFNWFFIYPSLEFSLFQKTHRIPRANMGVTGAALATALSITIGGIAMVLINEKTKELSIKDYIFSRNIHNQNHTDNLHETIYNHSLNFFVVLKSLGFHFTLSLKNLRKLMDKDMMRTYIVVGMPAFFTSVITSLGRVLFTAMIIPLGTSVYAAHSISFTAESAFYIPAVGMASAVAVLSGNVKGEGNQKKLNHQTNLVCILIIIIMLMATSIMLLFANSIISIFTTDAYIRKTSPVLLRIVALNEPFFGVSIVMQSVFNGIGKTKPPLIISAFTQWCVRILGVFIFVSILGFGIKTAWLCMISDNIVRAILLYSWYWISMKGNPH